MDMEAENNEVYENNLPIVAQLISLIGQQQDASPAPPDSLDNVIDSAQTAPTRRINTARAMDDSLGDDMPSSTDQNDTSLHVPKKRRTDLSVKLAAITHIHHLRMGSDQTRPLSNAHIRNVRENVPGAHLVGPWQIRKWWVSRNRLQEIQRLQQVTAPPVQGHIRCHVYHVELKKNFLAAVSDHRQNMSLASPLTAGDVRAAVYRIPQLGSVQVQLLRDWWRHREAIEATRKTGPAVINRSTVRNHYTSTHPTSWHECVRKEIKTFIDNSVYLSVRMSSLCAFRCAQLHIADFNRTVDLNHYFVHPYTMHR